MDIGLRRRTAALIQPLRSRWQRRQSRWLDLRLPAEQALRLHHRNVFILPTRYGAVLSICALVLLVVANAQRQPVPVLLALLLLSLFFVSLIQCFRTLSGLQLSSRRVDGHEPTRACFAGERVSFTVTLHAASARRSHQQLLLGFAGDSPQTLSVEAGSTTRAELSIQVEQRGLFKAPRLMLGTLYPLGLWRAWSRPDLAMSCVVYPRPLACALPARRGGQSPGDVSRTVHRHGGPDDFAGLRDYQAGDSLRRIHWQSLARGQGLQTRQFVHSGEQQVMLDWDQFTHDHDRLRDTEEILSCLCYQIVQLSARHWQIGLKMPGLVIEPAAGPAHRERLLQVLATW
jgi:uncharacterized protein (DUF58 family)